MSFGEKTLSRREMLGTLGLAALTLSGCQSLLNSSSTANRSPFAPNHPPLGLAYVTGANRHTLQGHAESALRAEAVVSRLKPLAGKASLIPDRMASLEELLLVHDRDYIRSIEAKRTAGTFFTKSRWSPYAGPYAFEAASLAVGASIDLARAVADGRVRNGFAVTRPPGHHARANSAGGYCIFNNAAIAARALQTERKRRIAIVDIDVHHGNGIEEAFYREPSVLYISTHQNDWPFTGALEKTGEGPARGTNINIPLPPQTGDVGLKSVYKEIVIPALRRFQPEIILVAAGFDTHWRDPQGSFICSLTGIQQITSLLNDAALEICQGRIVYLLEGGYQLDALSQGVKNVVVDLLKTDRTAFSDVEIENSMGSSGLSEADVSDVIRNVRKLHGI